MAWASGLELADGSGNVAYGIHQNVEIMAARGNQVLNGLDVTANGSSDLTTTQVDIDIADGDVLVNGAIYALSSIPSIDLSEAYDDLTAGQSLLVLIYVKSDGTISDPSDTGGNEGVGTPATTGQQLPPDLLEDTTALALITLTNLDTTVDGADIEDYIIYTPDATALGDGKKSFWGDDADLEQYHDDAHAWYVNNKGEMIFWNKSGSAVTFLIGDSFKIKDDDDGDVTLLDFNTNISGGRTLAIGTAADTMKTGINIAPVTPLHVYEETTSNAGGITIEQDGTGDALLQFLLTGATRWVMGIDNSDATNSFRISSTADLSTDPTMILSNTGLMSLPEVTARMSMGIAPLTRALMRLGPTFTDVGTDVLGIDVFSTLTGASNNTSYKGFQSHLILNHASQTITDAYGMYIKNPTITLGNITNNYGLYIEAISGGGTLNYSLYVAGAGTSFLGGTVFFGNADTNLYRSAADILKTDDNFDALSLKIGGVEKIDSGGNFIWSGDVLPDADSTRDLGSTSLYWQNTYSDNYLSNAGSYRITDTDVTHGMTDLYPTDVAAVIETISTTDGGLEITGLSDSATTVGLQLRGFYDGGTTAPAIRISMGEANGTTTQAISSSNVAFQMNDASTVYLKFHGSGAPRISIPGTTSGVAVHATESGPYLLNRDTSSARYKENIEDINLYSLLDSIYSLQPKKYNRKETGNLEWGYIAEEVAEVLPQVVYFLDDQPEAWNTASLVVLLVEELKRLNNRISTLEDKSLI